MCGPARYWYSGSGSGIRSSGRRSGMPSVSNQLTTNQTLTSGNYLLSPNGQYAAVMHTDGNFVLCYTRNGAPDLSRPYWSAASDATDHYVQGGKRLGAPYYAIMQADGNFVLYNGTKDKPGPPYWATNTSRAAGQFTAVLQDDGN